MMASIHAGRRCRGLRVSLDVWLDLGGSSWSPCSGVQVECILSRICISSQNDSKENGVLPSPIGKHKAGSLRGSSQLSLCLLAWVRARLCLTVSLHPGIEESDRGYKFPACPGGGACTRGLSKSSSLSQAHTHRLSGEKPNILPECPSACLAELRFEPCLWQQCVCFGHCTVCSGHRARRFRNPKIFGTRCTYIFTVIPFSA